MAAVARLLFLVLFSCLILTTVTASFDMRMPRLGSRTGRHSMSSQREDGQPLFFFRSLRYYQ